jgi:hypothetical protein
LQQLLKIVFTGDGSTTSYTLSRNAVNAFDLEVFIGNVRQEPESAYTVSGATLAFTGTPANGEVIYVVHQAGALQTVKAPVDHGARDFSILWRWSKDFFWFRLRCNSYSYTQCWSYIKKMQIQQMTVHLL